LSVPWTICSVKGILISSKPAWISRVIDRRVGNVDSVRKLLEDGIKDGVFPGAVLLVAKGGRVVFFHEAGYRSIIPQKLPMKKDTVFDLASLTKPLATTLALMKLVEEGVIALDQPLSELISSAFLGDKADLTPRLLLSHAAGLADWKPYYMRLVDHPVEHRKELLRDWIIQEPFAYRPGKGTLYSDLGFMLLEWVIEERAGESLTSYVHRCFYGPLGLKRTLFSRSPGPPRLSEQVRDGGQALSPAAGGGETHGNREEGEGEGIHLHGVAKGEFAATEDCPWRKKVVQGEVDDENAWALGGCSGHAGLFSTAEEVHIVTNMLREHYFGMRRDFFKPKTVKEFLTRQNIVEGSDWALGWDTRAPEGSSAGKHFSRGSVGHTGFTGTSIWMDLEKDVAVIFLTNRVHPTRNNDRIKILRPKLHDAVMEALGLN
jgi:CubicO group peptidase (beta-lactamase class C family)